MHRNLKIIAGVLALGAAGAVLAQSVEGLDLQAIQNTAERQGQDMAGFLKQVVNRGDEVKVAAQEAADTGMEQMRRLDTSKLPKMAGGDVDLDELVAGAQDSLKDPKGAPLFIAFASLSMPQDALKRMIQDVTHAGGVVVFRGLPQNNGKAFIQGMRAVVDQGSEANISIDPRLFRAFDVKAAPTYVAVSTGFRPCDGLDCVTDVPAFDRLVGNVTTQYALERFAQGNGAGAAVARVALGNMVGKP